MLNLKPDLRPSAKKVLHHPIFWADKKSLEFILKIRRKFDVLDPKFASKIKYGMEHQKVLMETPIVQRLKVALDVDKSVVKSDWKAKLDKTLAEEFKGGYDKESVSDLLRAMRNKVIIPLNLLIIFIKFLFDFKWMHKEELNDTIKALFGDFTEGEYLNYFTSRYPRLLVHCYNAVEKEARELLSEFFHQSKNELSAKAVDTPGFNFEGSKLIINCQDITTFPETNVLFDSVEIFGITHLFIEQNKSFTNFFHKNGSTVTQLEFFYGSLKFDSVNKILQKLPNLKKLKFDDVEYEAPKMNQTIPPSTCQNLVELLIWSLKRSNLFQAFQECPTIQKLTVWFPEVTLEGILQKFSSLEELTVDLNDKYPVTPTVTSKNHQLKVLQIKLDTRDEKIQQKLFAFIQKQSHLQKFSFVSKNYSPSQSLCKQLSAHICQLQHLTSLEINDIVLLGEVEAFVANSPTANSRLLALVWQLEPIKSPSTFFGHFTNLKQLDIGCTWVDDSKIYKNLVSFMNATKLTSITLRWLPPACFQCFKQLEVHSLQFLDILVDNESQDKVPAFEILQEVLKKHPNITDFKIQFDNDYDEQKSLELIPMIVGLSSKLERLVIVNYSKITPEVINQIAALKVLKWQINEHKSETFYKTFWKNLKLSMLLNPPAISSRYSYPMGTIRELPR